MNPTTESVMKKNSPSMKLLLRRAGIALSSDTIDYGDAVDAIEARLVQTSIAHWQHLAEHHEQCAAESTREDDRASHQRIADRYAYDAAALEKYPNASRCASNALWQALMDAVHVINTLEDRNDELTELLDENGIVTPDSLEPDDVPFGMREWTGYVE